MQYSALLVCGVVATLGIAGCADGHRGAGRSGKASDASAGGDGGRDSTSARAAPDASESEPSNAGRCLGARFECARIDTQTCVEQAGCYPTQACNGQEIDCAEVSPDSCDDFPHCYTASVDVFGSPQPVCRQYASSCLTGAPPECAAYGGTCATVDACAGDAEPCEGRRTEGACRAHQGCAWSTAL